MCQKTREIASCDRHQGFVEPEPTQGRGRYVTAQIPYPHARVAGGQPRQCPEIYWTAHRRRQGPRPPEQTEAWSAVTLFSRFRTALRENPSRSRWVSQSLLTLEDTRHPLFAYYLRQWGQVWARTHAYQLTFKRKLKRIERLARLLRDVGLTAEVKKEIEFQARYGIWQQPRARGHQLSPILSQNRRKTSERGTPHSGIRPEPECY